MPLPRALLALSAFLFVAACALPALAFSVTKDPKDPLALWTGIQVLATGWLGLFTGQLGWFANPFWFVGGILILANRRSGALVLTVLAFAVSLHTLTIRGQTVPADEAGTKTMTVESLRPGCYVWLSAIAISVGAAFALGPAAGGAPPKLPPPL